VLDSFRTRRRLRVGDREVAYASLPALAEQGWDVARLPFSHRVLLENLLRHEDGSVVGSEDVEALLRWDAKAPPELEIQFTPARVLLQDFTGVPAVVDLAAMRDAMARLGGDPKRIDPLLPAELVIDHSVQVDAFGRPDALARNVAIEFERNRERYEFLRWGQEAFQGLRVVPPSTGIVHQVNLEHLARVVMDVARDGETWACFDSVVGTDSHTTMINGLGVLGWGVGGIEAEAGMLGQPISMLLPQVVGVRLTGRLPAGSTATDLVLRVTELLRGHGVVGKFVEFFGPGVAGLPLADRATIANMAPEYGATCGLFPIDRVAIDYLRLTGRPPARIALVEAYAEAQGLLAASSAREAEYSAVIELELASIEPCLAGPKRPQDRVALAEMRRVFGAGLDGLSGRIRGPEPPAQAVGRWESEGGDANAVREPEPAESGPGVPIEVDGERVTLAHGSVVIAAITSCTNTSNPSVMVAAGLLARKAVQKGLARRPWVKTSLAPGSKVVTDYLRRSGLLSDLERLGFYLVGYGCTTCIGNSGPLPEPVAEAVEEHGLVVASVLSGNRNFEGRVHPLVRANYLASPPLVVAFALAGRVDVDLTQEPLGTDRDGRPVRLAEIWASADEVAEVVRKEVDAESFTKNYADVFAGEPAWRSLPVPGGATYAWQDDSTYVKHPPYFEGMPREAPGVADLAGARCLALFGDSITTDHISPAGSIPPDGPAGRYLVSHGVAPRDFNSFGSRRGNHEVMMRGTFANLRIRNRLAPGSEGGVTRHLPSGETLAIYDAAMRYRDEGVPLVVIAGQEYGTGSSRDWAAKGPMLLGVRAVIARSFERIHRTNLVGMGVLPLQFPDGESAESLGLGGEEIFAVAGLQRALDAEPFRVGSRVEVVARKADGEPEEKRFEAVLRVDTPNERDYVRHGGILPYVLRRLLESR